MQPNGKNGEETAVAVVRGIRDKLIIHRNVDGLPNLKIVASLESLFPSVIQMTVARRNSRAHGFKKFLRCF
jgi:hypothetical protein